MPDSLYDRDFVAWSESQADRLRRLAAGERVNDLDWVNLIEEVETLGRSETTGVRSFLRLALLHALKVIAWPQSSAGRKWRNEIGNFLAEARDRFTPSMAQAIDVEEVYRAARRQLAGLSMPSTPGPVPERLTMTLGDLLDEELTPDALIARLRDE